MSDAARDGDGWKSVANVLKVPTEVAHQWTKRYVDGPDSAARLCGGSTPKLSAMHVRYLCECLDENSKTALDALPLKLFDEFFLGVFVDD